MRKLGLVIYLVAAGCGDASPGVPTQVGAAPDFIGAVALGGYTGLSPMSAASAAFGTQPVDFAGVALPKDCTSLADPLAEIDPTAMAGIGDRDLGPEVVIQSGSTAVTASRSETNGRFTYTGTGTAELVAGAAYDLVAAQAVPPLTVSSVVRTPAALTISAPSSFARLTPGSALDVKWSGSGGDWVAVVIFPTSGTGAGVACIAPDTGSFTIPAAATSLAGAASSYVLAVGRQRTQMTKVAGLGTVMGTGSSGAYVLLMP